MSERPRCQHCQKLLRPYTTHISFRNLPPDQLPKTKAEAQRRTNLRITSVERGTVFDEKSWSNKRRETLSSVNVWDGETFNGYPHIGKAPLFCGVNCAARYGVQMVVTRDILTAGRKKA